MLLLEIYAQVVNVDAVDLGQKSGRFCAQSLKQINYQPLNSITANPFPIKDVEI